MYGMDYYFDYNKLCLASLYLNELKVPLIVTNDDGNALIRKRILPGCGAGLEAILATSKLKRKLNFASS